MASQTSSTSSQNASKVICLLESPPAVSFKRSTAKNTDAIMLLDDEDDENEAGNNYESIDALKSNLSRYMKKVVTQINDDNPDLDERAVIQTVQIYCKQHPKEQTIKTIAEACLKILRKGLPVEGEDNDDLLRPIVDEEHERKAKKPKLANSKANKTTKTSSTTKEIVLLDDNDDNNNHNNNNETVYDIDDNDEVVMGPFIRQQTSPLQEIIRIFPNAKLEFIEKLLKDHGYDTFAVAQIMLDKGYEKEEIVSREGMIGGDPSKKECKYDFTSITWETPKEQYRYQAMILLQLNFPCIIKKHIEKLFERQKWHYFPTVKCIEELLDHQITANFQCLNGNTMKNPKFAKVQIESWYALLEQKKSDKNNTNNKAKEMTVLLEEIPITFRANVTNLPSCPKHFHPVLEQEIAFTRRYQLEQIETQDLLYAKELNQQDAKEHNELFECGCCYDNECSFESMIQCSEGCLFCKNCLQQYVETTVFGNGQSKLTCMNTIEACPGIFSESMLRVSLPPKVLQKYSEAIQRDELQKAQLENLIKCFACSLSVEMSDEAGNVFHCPQCHKDTCRLCQEESHIPLKCSEVEKKDQTNIRLSVEEAMTLARVRECPKCKTRFFKTEGCNKMTCGCGTILCYLCRVNITKDGYKHFCQTPHCDHSKCQKCKLYTNSIEDDRKAMLEAGLKTMEAKKEELAAANNTANGSSSSANANGENHTIEIEKLLEGGAIKPATTAAVAAVAAAGFGGAIRALLPIAAPPPPVAAPARGGGAAGLIQAVNALIGRVYNNLVPPPPPPPVPAAVLRAYAAQPAPAVAYHIAPQVVQAQQQQHHQMPINPVPAPAVPVRTRKRRR